MMHASVPKGDEFKGNVSNLILLGPLQETGMSNRFTCYAVHSKMSHNTNDKSNAMKLYTDTDFESRSEIITDINIKKPV